MNAQIRTTAMRNFLMMMLILVEVSASGKQENTVFDCGLVPLDIVLLIDYGLEIDYISRSSIRFLLEGLVELPLNRHNVQLQLVELTCDERISLNRSISIDRASVTEVKLNDSVYKCELSQSKQSRAEMVTRMATNIRQEMQLGPRTAAPKYLIYAGLMDRDSTNYSDPIGRIGMQNGTSTRLKRMMDNGADMALILDRLDDVGVVLSMATVFEQLHDVGAIAEAVRFVLSTINQRVMRGCKFSLRNVGEINVTSSGGDCLTEVLVNVNPTTASWKYCPSNGSLYCPPGAVWCVESNNESYALLGSGVAATQPTIPNYRQQSKDELVWVAHYAVSLVMLVVVMIVASFILFLLMFRPSIHLCRLALCSGMFDPSVSTSTSLSTESRQLSAVQPAVLDRPEVIPIEEKSVSSSESGSLRSQPNRTCGVYNSGSSAQTARSPSYKSSAYFQSPFR